MTFTQVHLVLKHVALCTAVDLPFRCSLCSINLDKHLLNYTRTSLGVGQPWEAFGLLLGAEKLRLHLFVFISNRIGVEVFRIPSLPPLSPPFPALGKPVGPKLRKRKKCPGNRCSGKQSFTPGGSEYFGRKQGSPLPSMSYQAPSLLSFSSKIGHFTHEGYWLRLKS